LTRRERYLGSFTCEYESTLHIKRIDKIEKNIIIDRNFKLCTFYTPCICLFNRTSIIWYSDLVKSLI